MIFLLTLGLLSLTMASFLLGSYISIIRKRRCVGKICGIDGRCSPQALGVMAFHIEVQFNDDGQDIKLVALNSFIVLPFFEKMMLSKLKKHVGRQVHIYFDPDNNARVLLREYMWKEFLMCFFLLLLGSMLITAGVVFGK